MVIDMDFETWTRFWVLIQSIQVETMVSILGFNIPDLMNSLPKQSKIYCRLWICLIKWCFSISSACLVPRHSTKCSHEVFSWHLQSQFLCIHPLLSAPCKHLRNTLYICYIAPGNEAVSQHSTSVRIIILYQISE